jgi:hypothetical protein
MFDFWPKQKSVDEIIKNANLTPAWQWTPTQTLSMLQAQNDLIEQFLKENHDLKAELKSIEEDGTEEHNNAIKLREENVQLKGTIDELNKEVLGLRHLKKENVELMERVNEIDSDQNEKYRAEIFTLKNECTLLRSKNNTLQEFIDTKIKVDWKSARIDILERDLQKCAEQRDEYKAEVEKLKKDIVDYVLEKDDMIDKLQKELNHMKAVAEGAINLCDLSGEKRTEKYYVCNHCGYKVAHDTSYWGGCGFCKDGLMIEKEEAVQKHPMYPLHWGGYDKNIKEFVESEFNNEDPVESVYNLLNKAKDLTEGVEVDLDKSLDEQCDKEEPAFLNCACEDCYDKTKQYNQFQDAHAEKWQCPCNICKQSKEKTWEEAASDLALRVIKLEKQIEELKIVNICQKLF